MSETSNYEAQKKKLQGLCDEHNFTFRFFKDRYPITLVITPINDVSTQMDSFCKVVIQFIDGLSADTGCTGKFRLSHAPFAETR